MDAEKEVTYKVFYLDPAATPDIIKCYGAPRVDGTTVTFKVGHSHGFDNFLTLYEVEDMQVVK